MRLIAIILALFCLMGCIRVYQVTMTHCRDVTLNVQADVPKEVVVETEADIIPVP